MILKPLMTEKSLKDAKNGVYSFLVDKLMTKGSIKGLINKVFGVHVTSVKTMNFKGGQKRNMRGKKVTFKAFKKTLVTLQEKEKIDLFEEKGKK
jgi:large subunit ribosomal protein L23